MIETENPNSTLASAKSVPAALPAGVSYSSTLKVTLEHSGWNATRREAVGSELTELRELISEAWAAHIFEGRLQPRDARCEAARAATSAVYDRIAEVEQRIYAKPVRTLADIQERAEIAKFWLAPQGEPIDGLTSGSGRSRASAELLAAVLALRDGIPAEPSQ